MANDEHVALLKKGMAAWNAWRDDNPDIRPDLSYADLRGTNLVGTDLRVADLRGARLAGADLRKANLADVDLNGAYGGSGVQTARYFSRGPHWGKRHPCATQRDPH